MLSRNIVLTGKDQVEFLKEAVRDPETGEVTLKARKTLMSTGTEGICLSRLFEPGSHWDRWVTYPFHPGYLMVAEVVAVGPHIDQIHEGDRFGVLGCLQSSYSLVYSISLPSVPHLRDLT